MNSRPIWESKGNRRRASESPPSFRGSITAPTSDRWPSYILSGVLLVLLFGFAVGRPDWQLVMAAFLAGFCISGGQKSVIALAAIYYPNAIRSTEVDWALGIGR